MKKIKRTIAMFLAVICCFSMSVVAFAAETSSTEDVTVVATETVEPRFGIGGFENHYHSAGHSYGEFTIATESLFMPSKKFTVQSSDFNDYTVFDLYIYNSNNQLVTTFTGRGNAKWADRPMSSNFINGDTYTIRYYIKDSSGNPVSNDDGWIGMWIF